MNNRKELELLKDIINDNEYMYNKLKLINDVLNGNSDAKIEMIECIMIFVKEKYGFIGKN